MILFLDTEWSETMPDGTQFVSLGLVGLDARFEFYSERDPLPTPNDFVFSVVYPLLDRGPAAMSDVALALALWRFLDDVATQTGERPTIAYDYWQDRSLFLDVWRGLDAASEVTSSETPDVGWLDLKELDPLYTRARERHFAINEDARRRRHHALVDAHAARAGYLHALRILAGG
jgi:hypothetical protein